MRLEDIGGELGLVERVRTTYAGAKGDGLIIPIGDDAAVIDVPGGMQLAISADMLVENVHFRRDWSDPYSIGWKAAAVNLSDMAAMGAAPTFAFLSLAVSAQETVEGIERILDGFSDCLNRYGARLAGGDTNASPEHLVLSATVTGTVAAGRALTRAGARPGDAILVTGTLGNSAAGLIILAEHGPARGEKVNKDLMNIHRRPQPRIIAGRAAAATGKVRASMDLSDGLLADLKKLCNASHVGARIETAALPITTELRRACELIRRDPIDLALGGGEDYELLLVVPQADVSTVREAIEAVGMPVAVIGEIVKTGWRIVAPNGQEEHPVSASGWDHFAPS